MDNFQPVLLGVWQEACRHIEIAESTQRITDILVHKMPIDRLLVRRVEPDRGCVETVAIESIAAPMGMPESRTECDPGLMDSLAAWCREGQIRRLASAEPGSEVFRAAVPDGLEGEILLGPLNGAGDQLGLLIITAPAGHGFDAQHEALTQVLLEPFSVALENDHRLREMAALREAAEADKQSLLARLGRRKLGDTIVGEDTGLRAVMERVELVARSDVPVLIFGETGTGKELVARAIHTRSPRASGPIHRVNCGAIPPELIDSQLFGHERGSFTGADEMRKGWFERADGGTLFLDEIGELPLAAQVRLLRILQDGSLERVGGQHPLNVDVRIVAATHRDLAQMVAEGKFRQDLWYRLAVFPIVLPPLRERLDDIPAMARHFAERAATRFGLAAAMPTADDIRLMTSYAWPGNVRELATVIDRAAILGNGERLEVATALGVTNGLNPPSGNGDHPAASPSAPVHDIIPLDAAMKRHIEAALSATRGRIEGPQGAGAILDINPHTLRARMRKLGIDWEKFRR